jgi:hypothetical protein
VLPYQVSSPSLTESYELILSCVYPALRTFHRLLFYKDWALAFTIGLRQKNAHFLLRWLVRFMLRINSKHHKKFLTFLDVFFARVDACGGLGTKHLGIKFVIYGKISVTGNAKTRGRHLGAGKRSLSSRALRVSYSQRQAHTATGVLGIKCFIFY